MQIALVNRSTSPLVTAPLLAQIASSIEQQLCEDYASFWQSAGVAVTHALPTASDSQIVMLDDSDQAGALGYHDVTPEGQPYAKVFVSPILNNGGTIMSGDNSVSACISHEALEMLGDAYANFWADGPNQEYALELCDPVENDSYVIRDVAVSNFVGPRWFRDGPGPFDWMRKLSNPFTMSSGGYLIVRSDSANVHQIFGESYPEWKMAGKTHAAARTRRRGVQP